MGQTPQRFPGAALEDDSIQFQDRGTDVADPGALWRRGDDIYGRDGTGVFNLRSGSGITEPQHEALDTLTHEISETSYDEVTYSGNKVSSYIVWETAAKLKKIREETYTYSGGKVSQAVTMQYDAAGVLKTTLTEVYTYSGNKVSSIARTRS